MVVAIDVEVVFIGLRFGTDTFVRAILVVLTIFDLPRRIVVVFFLVCPEAAQVKTNIIKVAKINVFFIVVNLRLLNFIDYLYQSACKVQPKQRRHIVHFH